MNPGGKRKTKVAFLGGALNSAAGSAHYSAISIDNNFELVAGCFSRNTELNRTTAEHYGVPSDRVYKDLNELLQNEKGKVDAIILLTPQNQHAQQVLDCINSAVPVICEKALANSSAEAISIKNAIEKNKGFLAVIYNYLGYPMIRELKHIIEQGTIGKVQLIQIEMPQEGFKRVAENGKPIIPQDWRLHDGPIPTISLDLGAHLHMIVRYITGETPVNVVGTSQTLGNFSTIIDDVSCIIEYSNKLICNMWYSKIAIGNRNGLKIRVYGEVGSAEWIQEKPEYLYLANNKGYRWKIDRGSIEVNISNQPRYTRFKAGHPGGFIEAFANYYFDIAASLEQYLNNGSQKLGSNCFGVREALEGLQLFEAVSKSSATKKWEKISLTS